MPTAVVATVAVQTFRNGTQTTPTRAVPAGFVAATVQVNCTTGNVASPFTGFKDPFSSAAMAITFGVEWSWDGGTTFPESTESVVTGQPTGVWGTDRHTGAAIMAPTVGLGLPFDAGAGGSPAQYRAYMVVAGGPITFGLTVSETTA